MLQYTWAYIVFGKRCLSSCRTLWVCFSLGFSLMFCFLSILRLCGLASVLLRCRLFLPDGPIGSKWITVESLMSQLIKNTIQTNNKKQQPQDNSLNIFTDQIFTGQLFSLTITSMRILCSLCFYFLSKKETCHMESGVVSLVIIKLPYCLCGELVVSVELVTAYKALVNQNVHFL